MRVLPDLGRLEHPFGERPYAVLEGVNKADRRLLLAASTLHEAQLDAACMRIAVQAAQIRLLELHVARFKRLRRVQRRR